MNNRELYAVYLYARALGEFQGTHLSAQELQQLQAICACTGDRSLVSSVTFFAALYPKKLRLLYEKCCDSYGLVRFCAPLLDLLERHQQLVLFFPVLKRFYEWYCVETQTDTIEIQCAVQPSSEQLDNIVRWYQAQAQARHVIPTLTVEPALLAGFRIIGKRMSCDYSVRHRLRALAHIWNKDS